MHFGDSPALRGRLPEFDISGSLRVRATSHRRHTGSRCVSTPAKSTTALMASPDARRINLFA